MVLVDKNNNCIYNNAVSLSDKFVALSNGSIDKAYNSSNATLIDAVIENFVVDAYKYDGENIYIDDIKAVNAFIQEKQVKKDEEIAQATLNKERDEKLKAIEEIIVSKNNVEYDAHTRGRSDINGVVALANFKFNQALVTVMPELQPIYDAIYKSTVDWKCADNKVHTVQVESIAEVGIDAMNEYAKAIGAQ